MRKSRAYHGPLDFLFILIIVFFDQISKWWAFEEILEVGQGVSFFAWLAEAPEYHVDYQHAFESILPFVNFVMVWNNGISFGILNSNGGALPAIITLVTVAIIGIFSVWMVKTDNRALAGGLSMVIGGALGNLIDRLRFDAVADFLDFHVFGWHWPAFNLADTCIVLGIGFALFDSLFLEPQRRSLGRNERTRSKR